MDLQASGVNEDSLTQLRNVCSTILGHDATVLPSMTRLLACSLNAAVDACFGIFRIVRQ